MSDLICVTNRSLCNEDFLTRLSAIAAAKPNAILLREKDLSEDEYHALAKQVLSVCESHGVPLVIHSFAGIARRLGINRLHLPMPLLRAMKPEERAYFSVLGASCHSVEEAAEAQTLGCTYLVAGHIFETDCKAGLPGRGIPFLREVCQRVSIPVYAIGGITKENYSSVRQAGGAGACLMQSMMRHPDITKYMEEFCHET